MEQSPETNLQKLFENLIVYYDQEFKSLNNRILNLITEISNIRVISTRRDLYNITLIMEEVEYLTNYVFCMELVKTREKICKKLSDVCKINEPDIIISSIKMIKDMLLEYKLSMEIFFENRKKKIQEKRDVLFLIDDLSLFDKNLNNTHLYNNEKKPLINIYLKHLNGGLNTENLIEFYNNFFKKLKQFIKTKNNLLPLEASPVIDLLKLLYFIRKGGGVIKFVCNTDLLFLKALTKVYRKYENIFSIRILKNINRKPGKYKNLLEALADNKDIKKIFDYNIYVISEYFSDFNIYDLIFKTSGDINKKSNNMLDIIQNDIKDIPKKILDIEKIYEEVKNKHDMLSKFLHPKKDVSFTPSEILFNLANFYFSQNIKFATYINSIIHNENNEEILTFIKFEGLFHKIANLVHERLDIFLLRKEIANILASLNELNSLYKIYETEENKILSSIKKGNIVALDNIFKTYEAKNYKEIVSKNIDKKDNYNKSLEQVNKLIDSKQYEEAVIKAKEITFLKIEEKYYGIPKLIDIYNLPPLSSKASSIIKEDSIIHPIIELNDEYWRV